MENIIEAINAWIDTIQQYSYEEICRQPPDGSWSLGQLCVHLINDTNWFLDQIKECIATTAFVNEKMSSFAKIIFNNNSFPNKKLTNPANENMPQPTTKQYLLHSFIQLQSNVKTIANQLIPIEYSGKTKHPGLGYFNAQEWLQFAAMHLKHHIKQKERIEKFLKTNRSSRLSF